MMLRLITATLAGLYVVSSIYGDPERQPEVGRASVASDAQGLSLAAFAGVLPDPQAETESRKVSRLSDAEAVRMALEAGAKMRADRSHTLRGSGRVAELTPASGAQSATDAVEDAAQAPMWVVTGDRVNLRQGPGTGTAVVGQVTLGTEADVLSEGNGWYQIRTADGNVTGWIFGKFLEKRDG